MKNNGFQKDRRSHTVLTVVFTIIAIAYLYPIFIVLVNSLKSNAAINLDTFAFPTSGTFMGLQNYIKGMTFGNYPFYRSVEYSLMITLLSSALILICTSMAAWYISRVDSLICRVVYYLCVFSMVVPVQMVMFTLAKTADTLRQDIGDGECQHIDDEQRHEREQRRVPERVQEAIVLENGLVVLQAHPSPFAGCLELAERQKQALGKRIQEAHAERGERRQQKQPAPALDRPADQAT